jgi:hypothetical protein
LRYLADGCGVSDEEMKAVVEAERAGEHRLVSFLTEHFCSTELLEEERAHKLNARYGHLVERKA